MENTFLVYVEDELFNNESKGFAQRESAIQYYNSLKERAIESLIDSPGNFNESKDNYYFTYIRSDLRFAAKLYETSRREQPEVVDIDGCLDPLGLLHSPLVKIPILNEESESSVTDKLSSVELAVDESTDELDYSSMAKFCAQVEALKSPVIEESDSKKDDVSSKNLPTNALDLTDETRDFLIKHKYNTANKVYRIKHSQLKSWQEDGIISGDIANEIIDFKYKRYLAMNNYKTTTKNALKFKSLGLSTKEINFLNKFGIVCPTQLRNCRKSVFDKMIRKSCVHFKKSTLIDMINHFKEVQCVLWKGKRKVHD